ncbi:MAG: hypothetical protein ACE5D1_01115, partial [Fidelibacterota bacterium]
MKTLIIILHCFFFCFFPMNVFPQTVYGVSGVVHDSFSGADIDSFFVRMQAVNDSSLVDSGFFNGNDWSLNFSTVGIDDNTPQIPKEFVLGQNYPNPFNPSTRIPFSVSEAGNYTLESFNLLGQTVSKFNTFLQPGTYEVEYGFGTTASGFQVVRLSGEGYSQTIKVISLDGGSGTGFEFLGNGPEPTRPNAEKLSQSLGKKLIDGEIEVSIKAEKEGYQTSIDTVVLMPGDNFHDLLLRANSYLPFLRDSIPDFTIAEDDTLLLDMDDYLVNPDNHSLEYWFININVVGGQPILNGELANIYFPENFNGTVNSGVTVVDLDSAGFGFNQLFDINVLPVNDAPSVSIQTLVDSVYEDYLGFLNIGSFTVSDADDGDTYTAYLMNSNPDSVFLSIEGNNIRLDSLAQDYNGVVDYGLLVEDSGGLTASDNAQLTVNPMPDSTNIHFIFKAMYGDTTLTSGVSTLTYRKMFSDSSGYAWGEDSVKTSNNGEFDLVLEPGVYDINGMHSSAIDSAITNGRYVFLARPEQIGVIEQRAIDDEQSPILFNTDQDTINVFKLMADFPLVWAIEYASKLNGLNMGTRRFGNNDFNAPAWWNTNHMTPDSTRREWTLELLDELRTIPHMENFIMQYQESTETPDTPYLAINVDPIFPSPGTNLTNFDSETHEINFCEASYPPWPGKRTFRIEILQAIGDLEDVSGNDPNILTNGTEGYLINDVGRRI